MSRGQNCKICSKPKLNGRSYCRRCFLDKVAQQQKVRGRYLWTKTCICCGKGYQSMKKHTFPQCGDCGKLGSVLSPKAEKFYQSTNIPSKHVHRYIVEKALKRTLEANEVVHHLDENNQNNKLSNLAVMLNAHHAKLHRALSILKIAMFYQGVVEYWKSEMVIPMTRAYCDLHEIPILYLSDLN